MNELEQARLAISSYYSLSSAEQLEPDPTQVELEAVLVNENSSPTVEAVKEIEVTTEEHKQELDTRKRVKPKA